MKKNTTPVVDAIGELNFEGNIIPHSWYQHIKLPVGKRELKRKEGKQTPKADHVAIILLSDVIYWYRPTIRRDELTGAVIAIEKRFYEDMLQKQYEPWGELFGFTKRQTKDAVSRLVKAGLIKREFRSITTKNGTKLTNVMFVEPVVPAIKQITFTHQETRTIIEQLPPSDVQTSEVSRLNVAPTAFERQTNTEITSKISAEISGFIPIINDINISSPSIPESTKSVLSGALDEDELVIYVQTVVDYFNGLKGRYPNKVRAKIIRPAKRTTIDKYKDGKYRAIVKWYQQGIPAEYICDQLAKWIPALKTSVGGSLNYFENKVIDYISPERQAELDAYKAKLLEEYDERE